MNLSRLLFRGWVMVCVLAPALAYAQVGPDMLIKPWEEGEKLELLSSATFQMQTHVKESNEPYQMWNTTSLGRWRPIAKDESPVAGFETHYFEMSTPNPSIPDHLMDHSFTLGSPVGYIAPNWFMLAIAGAGYAGDSWFADSDSVYFMGTVLVGRKFDEDRALIFGLDYNGSRTFMPDIPLPGFAYRDLLNPQLRYTLGVPYSLIEWTPVKELEIKAQYSLLDRIEAGVEYHAVGKQISLVSRLTDNVRGFHLDADENENRRIFLRRKAIEGGLRWTPNANAMFAAVLGYQFGTSFRYGFDTRDTDLLAKPSDEMYVRFQVDLSF